MEMYIHRLNWNRATFSFHTDVSLQIESSPLIDQCYKLSIAGCDVTPFAARIYAKTIISRNSSAPCENIFHYDYR